MKSADDSRPVWLITGCSKGLGRALAEHVLAQGHRCVVTARNAAAISSLCSRYPATQALALELDVTRSAQIATVLQATLAAFGGVDVLVNNAGFGLNAGVEDAEETAVRNLFETNFFGMTAMIRAVLPSMRGRRKGHIVNVSSISGRVASAGSAYYAATKFAMEGLSQGLAKEVEPLGIRVSVIEPGPLRTDFQGDSMQRSRQPIADYQDTVGQRHARLRATHGRQEGDPARAASVIFNAVKAPEAPFQLVLGERAYEMADACLRRQRDELEAQRALARSIEFDAC